MFQNATERYSNQLLFMNSSYLSHKRPACSSETLFNRPLPFYRGGHPILNHIRNAKVHTTQVVDKIQRGVENPREGESRFIVMAYRYGEGT